VQDAGLPPAKRPRAVRPGPATPASTPNIRTRIVEKAWTVRFECSAADEATRASGIRPSAVEDLLARSWPMTLEIAHQVGKDADENGSEHVVGVAHVGHQSRIASLSPLSASGCRPSPPTLRARTHRRR